MFSNNLKKGQIIKNKLGTFQFVGHGTFVKQNEDGVQPDGKKVGDIVKDDDGNAFKFVGNSTFVLQATAGKKKASKKNSPTKEQPMPSNAVLLDDEPESKPNTNSDGAEAPMPAPAMDFDN